MLITLYIRQFENGHHKIFTHETTNFFSSCCELATILGSVEVCLFTNKAYQLIQTSSAFKYEEKTWVFQKIEQYISLQFTFLWIDGFPIQRFYFLFQFFLWWPSITARGGTFDINISFRCKYVGTVFLSFRNWLFRNIFSV